MSKEKQKHTPEIVNRRAEFEYTILESYEAGIQLLGTEIKSIRSGKANINDAYCLFQQGELYIKNMFIAEYKFGSFQNHKERRDRKLLLKKEELRKLDRKITEKGYTLIPLKIYFNDRGLAKLEIALAQGKKTYDKRQSIKEKDLKREMQRMEKYGR
jgi:SsrA-binding protein